MDRSRPVWVEPHRIGRDVEVLVDHRRQVARRDRTVLWPSSLFFARTDDDRDRPGPLAGTPHQRLDLLRQHHVHADPFRQPGSGE